MWISHSFSESGQSHVEQYSTPNLVLLVLTLPVLHIIDQVNHGIVDADFFKVTPILGGLQSGAQRTFPGTD